MKVFIREYCRDVNVRLYGIDGEERTKEFFQKYLSVAEGVYETTDEEKEDYFSEAVYTITNGAYFDCLAQEIDNIQKGIDDIAEAEFRDETVEDYIFDDELYVV